jgi:hypothetical protein
MFVEFCRMRGASIKAPLSGGVEAAKRLMPDSHNVVCAGRRCRALALDGLLRGGDGDLIVPDLGNRSGESALLTAPVSEKPAGGAVSGEDKAMRQPFQPLSGIWRSAAWRSGRGEKVWLSMLVEAMEDASRPELRRLPCDQPVLAELRAQLARPASFYPYGASHFSLRN